jgi:hypothetical protein
MTFLSFLLHNEGSTHAGLNLRKPIVGYTQSSITAFTLGGNGKRVDAYCLFRAQRIYLDYLSPLSTFTIRDMEVVVDIGFQYRNYPLSAVRIKELVFEDVKISFKDEITLSGPSEPVDLCAGSRLLQSLAPLAEVVRLRTGSTERVVESAEWETKQ